MNDPTEMAKNFVGQFYAAFDTNRASIVSLYQAGSSLSFEGDNTAGQAIAQKLSSLQLPPGSKHAITTTDAQPSCAGSGAVLVFVTGEFVGQKFQEVFQLVPQANGYYVHNQIFRVGKTNPFNAPPTSGGDVAKAFLQHYYTMFDTNRDGLVPLYRPQSLLTFEGQVKRGVQEIMAKLKELPKVAHDGNSFTVDSQAVNGQALILVFVTGQLTIDGQNPLKFTQTIILVQEGQGYYVGNDIFRLNYG